MLRAKRYSSPGSRVNCPLMNGTPGVRKQRLEPGNVAALDELLAAPTLPGSRGSPSTCCSALSRGGPAGEGRRAAGGLAAAGGPVPRALIAGRPGARRPPHLGGGSRSTRPRPERRAARTGEGRRGGRGPGAGQGRAGLRVAGRSGCSGRPLSEQLRTLPKVCGVAGAAGALAMRTLWMALCALARLWPGTLAGCAEAGRCCPGRDAACFVRGWRLDRVYGTCFCDQACRLTGDCCFDYARACPGGWRGRGWGGGGPLASSQGAHDPTPRTAAPGASIPQPLPSWRVQTVYPGLPLHPGTLPSILGSASLLHLGVLSSPHPKVLETPPSIQVHPASCILGSSSSFYPGIFQSSPPRQSTPKHLSP